MQGNHLNSKTRQLKKGRAQILNRSYLEFLFTALKRALKNIKARQNRFFPVAAVTQQEINLKRNFCVQALRGAFKCL